MRGEAATQATMLTAVTVDALVPQSHPIRRIKPMVDSALAALSPTFSRMYAFSGSAVDTSGTSSEGLPSDDVVLRAQ